MLAYILAVVVGLGSFSIYVAAFFFPEVHRKSDFWWSGVGLFYALILWTCAGRITGAVLLGQMASVSLLGWFGWQSLNLRRQVTPVAEQTKIPSQESTGQSVKFPKVGGKAKEESKTTPTETPAQINETVTAEEETGPESTEAMEEVSWETEVPTVAETPSPRELETTETLKNLTQPTETEPTETETETKSERETPGVGEASSQYGEVKSEAKQDKAKDSSQKKAGWFSMLVSNLKNLFPKKDKSKGKVETTSKSVSKEVESTAETPEKISETEPQARVAETETVETEVNVTEKEAEGITEVESEQTEETIKSDGEAEQVTVVEKEAKAAVELNDSWEETPEVSIIEEKVTATTDEVKAEETAREIESKEDELKTADKEEEVESQDKSQKVSSDVPSVSNKDWDSEKES